MHLYRGKCSHGKLNLRTHIREGKASFEKNLAKKRMIITHKSIVQLALCYIAHCCAMFLFDGKDGDDVQFLSFFFFLSGFSCQVRDEKTC